MRTRKRLIWMGLLALCSLTFGLNQALAQPDAVFTVDVTASGEGQVTRTPNKATYAYGEQVLLAAQPAANASFAGWTGDIGQQDWWVNGPGHDYRVPLTVDVNGLERRDKPAEIGIDFTALLGQLGVAGSLDLDSLRLIETDGMGKVLEAAVPFQFDPVAQFDAATNAAGTLVFMLEGRTEAGEERFYVLYFDVGGKSFSPPSFTPLVTVANDTDDGFASLRLETSAGTTYQFHKNGGGFGSVIDQDGNDWVSYSSAPKSAGDFRGIPNLLPPKSGGYFHPGRDTATTFLVDQGPLRVTFRSKTLDNKWRTTWYVYPAYASMTVDIVDGNYWFQYEGTPGGKLEASDYVVRSDGTTTGLGDTWEGDLSDPEWVFFADPNIDRSIFFAQHEDDDIVDAYRPQHDAPADDDGAMTVFSFGRDAGTSPYLTGTGRQFTFGLLEGRGKAGVAQSILAAVEPVVVTVGMPEERQAASQSTANPLMLTVTGDHTLTATFASESCALDIPVVGKGNVIRDPDKASYDCGESVTLTAVPTAGWRFDGWSDGLGTNPEVTITLDNDRVVAATFVAEVYALDITVEGQGSVDVVPLQATYSFGQEVTLTAVPAAGWKFTSWGGDLAGTNPEQRLTFDSDQSVVARFSTAAEQHFLPVLFDR